MFIWKKKAPLSITGVDKVLSKRAELYPVDQLSSTIKTVDNNLWYLQFLHPRSVSWSAVRQRVQDPADNGRLQDQIAGEPAGGGAHEVYPTLCPNDQAERDQEGSRLGGEQG